MKKQMIIFLLVISTFLSIAISQETCISMCDSSYPLHTVDKVSELQACTKGCRVQYISHLSRTEADCEEDCASGYGSKFNEKKACVTGCEEEKSIFSKLSKVLEVEETNDITFQFHFLRPVFMAKKYYYSLFNKQVESSAESSDSFYYVEQTTSSDGDGNSLFIQFEMYPDTRPKIVESQHSEELSRSREELDKDESSVYYYVNKIHGKTSQWLHCVHMKAGVPYATLVIILFLSLIMMAWICCSTCDDDDDDDERTEKKHTFSKSGLSIMADELQIKNFGEVKCFTISSLNNEDDEKLLNI